jgi:hypothetical protein
MPQKRKRRTRLHLAAFQEHHHRLHPRIRKAQTNHDPHHLLSIQNVFAAESIPFNKINLTADITMTGLASRISCSSHCLLYGSGSWTQMARKERFTARRMDGYLHAPHQLRRIEAVALRFNYTDEEKNWCAATLQYYVDGMDAVRRAARGIPESAVTRRHSGRPAAGRASGGDGRVEASPTGGASGGAGRVGASASGVRVRVRGGAAAAATPAVDGRRVAGGGDGAVEGNNSTEEEDEICASSQIISRKRRRGQFIQC